jgi:hypothetical protein
MAGARITALRNQVFGASCRLFCGASWRTIRDMDAALPDSVPLAVIMQRTALDNPWASEKWEAHGVLYDEAPADAQPRIIVDRADVTQVLHTGFRLKLSRDEAEGYYLNLTSPAPRVFVLWRWVDQRAQPVLVSVSYGEGTRWADSGEQVDGVALPPVLMPWLAAFVEAHYRPEPRKPKRYASNRDRGRMGHIG